MAALWDGFFSMGGHALYLWAAIIGVLVFVVLELTLLLLRRRSIIEHLGRPSHAGWKQDEIMKHTTDADGQQ